MTSPIHVGVNDKLLLHIALHAYSVYMHTRYTRHASGHRITSHYTSFFGESGCSVSVNGYITVIPLTVPFPFLLAVGKFPVLYGV
jgi:hypothetical protein